MACIAFEKISKTYNLGKVKVPALQNISFQVDRGDFVTVVGPSGSGKSTLLNIVGLLDAPDRGEVFLHETKVDFKKDRWLTLTRREKLGFIFQSFNLIPILNVYENVGYPLLNSPIPLRERKERILRLLEAAGLQGLAKRFPNELSGGQRQRVAIARALVRSPEIVLADEPTANLDSKTGRLIIDLMHTLNQEQQVTFIMATHDQEIISRSDNLLRLLDGTIVEEQV